MTSQQHFFRTLAGGLAGCGLALAAQAQVNYSTPAERDALARSAYARGDVARAASALNEQAKVNPFDPVALNNLAVNYAAQGDYQNAMSLLERALRIAPNRSDIMNNHANLRAWMAQDSQFALGSRPPAAPLNFQRAEDTPPGLPPLWTPPQQMQNPPVVRQPTPQAFQQQRGAAPAQQQYAQPQAQQYAQPVYAQQPAYAGQQPVYQQQPMQAVAVAARPVAAQSQSTRSNELTVARKKKKPIAVDCKVEP